LFVKESRVLGGQRVDRVDIMDGVDIGKSKIKNKKAKLRNPPGADG
jgi:hypothetical protein